MQIIKSGVLRNGFLAALIEIVSWSILGIQAGCGQSTSYERFPLSPTASDGVIPEEKTNIPDQMRQVVINGARLSDEQVRALEQRYNIAIQNGAYWYDSFSGAWGIQGGPLLGVGQAGLQVGGPLQADASNGNTGVFVNGRQLHMIDVVRLQQLGPVIPGRYWIDAQGNYGFEGWPAIGNLLYLAQQASQNSGGTINAASGTLYGKPNDFMFQGTGSGSSDDTFYSR
jgi:hypothetical protein